MEATWQETFKFDNVDEVKPAELDGCPCNKVVFVLGYSNEIAGEECTECGEIKWLGEYAEHYGVLPSDHHIFKPTFDKIDL